MRIQIKGEGYLGLSPKDKLDEVEVEVEVEGEGYFVYCKRGKRGRMEDRYSAVVGLEGDSKQVAKRECAVLDNGFSSSHPLVESKSSVRDRLGTNVELNNKRMVKVFVVSLCSINIPSIIRDHKELEISSEILLKWLDQDRFGLDVEFVQEILEQLPGDIACPFYVFLKERSAYSSSLTVGNGLLLAKTKDGVDLTNEETLDDSFEGCQEAKIPKFQYSNGESFSLSWKAY